MKLAGWAGLLAGWLALEGRRDPVIWTQFSLHLATTNIQLYSINNGTLYSGYYLGIIGHQGW